MSERAIPTGSWWRRKPAPDPAAGAVNGRLRRLLAGLAVAMIALMTSSASGETIDGPGGAQLTRVDPATLPGFAGDDAAEAFAAFRTSCVALVEHRLPQRPGVPPPPHLERVCAVALALPERIGAEEARAFFLAEFDAFRVAPPQGEGFLTGYYEPEVPGSLTRSERFRAPILGRPADLVTIAPGETPPGLDPALAAARRRADGTLEPYPDRAAIETGALAGLAEPIAWVEDPVEALMIHVQGSARLRLPDGSSVRLGYAGRNGQPYTSVGRILVTERGLKPEDVTLEKLKAWIRAAGQEEGQDGLAIIRRNRSFIFFRLDHETPPHLGPVAGQGVALAKLRSIAVDRTLWSYGLPFWIDADLPWRGEGLTPFRRLMVAQDTGSAILGPARADIFFGSGFEAGLRAGDIRHRGEFTVFLPRAETRR